MRDVTHGVRAAFWGNEYLDEAQLTDTFTHAPPLRDSELARRVHLGDRGALGELYRRHGAAAYSLAVRLVGPGEAEDVVHDVFLSLPSGLASYEERGAFGAWLRRVVARASLTRLRSARRRRETTLDGLTAPAPEHGSGDGDLERAIDQLPASLRSVLVLHAVEGFPHREVAGLLGISVIASRVRYSRAIAALRRVLGG